MSVLDAFVHDPLVEWEDEKRKLVSSFKGVSWSGFWCVIQEREAQRRNTVRDSVDLRHLAKNALYPIQKKLKGIYSMGKERSEKEISTSSLVQILIQEATDEANLVSFWQCLENDNTHDTFARLKCTRDGHHGTDTSCQTHPCMHKTSEDAVYYSVQITITPPIACSTAQVLSLSRWAWFSIYPALRW